MDEDSVYWKSQHDRMVAERDRLAGELEVAKQDAKDWQTTADVFHQLGIRQAATIDEQLGIIGTLQSTLDEYKG